MKSKWFEQRPVLKIVGISGSITNTWISLLIPNSRNQSRDATRQATLQHAGIQVRDSQAEAFGCKSAAQVRDPIPATDVGILAFRGRPTQGPVCTPLRWDRPERKEIVVALDRFELREQCQIRAISGQGFNETGDFLAGSVENTVVAFRLIKPISECPIG